jgi:hypothetical protein
MRGFGIRRTICNVRTPSPQPSPLWGEGVRCGSCCGRSWQTLPFPRRVLAPEFFLRAIENGARAGKIRSREARNRSGPGKGQGWGLLFGLPLRPFRPVARIERSEIRERRFGSIAAPGFRSAQPGLRNKMKEAERRQTLGSNRRILRCGARPFGARTLDGVPPRLSPKGIIPSPRLSFRPGFLGLGLNGRYPSSPVPVQGCTSHPGRNAGRHDAQAAREQAANPPAGTALAPMTRCASAPRPSRSEDCGVTDIETYVNKKVTRARTVISLSQQWRGRGEKGGIAANLSFAKRFSA